MVAPLLSIPILSATLNLSASSNLPSLVIGIDAIALVCPGLNTTVTGFILKSLSESIQSNKTNIFYRSS